MDKTDARPAWGFNEMSEDTFRRILQFGMIVSVSGKWDYTGADTTRAWLEVSNRDGAVMTLPRSWKSVLEFCGHSTSPGLFAFTYRATQMRDRLAIIDKWEAANAKDRAEFERLKAKFGVTPPAQADHAPTAPGPNDGGTPQP